MNRRSFLKAFSAAVVGTVVAKPIIEALPASIPPIRTNAVKGLPFFTSNTTGHCGPLTVKMFARMRDEMIQQMREPPPPLIVMMSSAQKAAYDRLMEDNEDEEMGFLESLYRRIRWRYDRAAA